jgi:multisubunit Na+/H+ antiporter MnhG subunit
MSREDLKERFLLRLLVIMLLVLIDNPVHQNFLADIYHTRGSSEEKSLRSIIDISIEYIMMKKSPGHNY